MKHNCFGISFVTFLIFFTSTLSHDYSTSFVEQSFTLKPLSERGEDYFKRMHVAEKAAQYGFLDPRASQAAPLAQCGNVVIGIEQGQLVSSTTCGEYTVSAKVDPLSLLQLLKDGSSVIARLVDINGHYYRADMRELREDMLYAIDKERYQIYHVTNAVFDSYETDFEYLTIKRHELEVVLAACGSKKSAARSAALEVKEQVEALIRSLEKKVTLSHGDRYQLTIKALERALQLIRKTEFKHKKDKAHMLHEYEQLLAHAQSRHRAYVMQQEIERTQKEALQLQREAMQQQCIESVSILEAGEQNPFYTWCADYYPVVARFLKARSDALHAIHKEHVRYRNQEYLLAPEVHALLAEEKVDSQLFTVCYGNQYQQALQHEAIAVIEETANLASTSVLYQHRGAIVQCAEAACAYNCAGELQHATTILDFCWSLLSWGATVTQAVLEGAAVGVVGAVVDLYEHSVQATISFLIGSRVMLAYQLSKVLYTVADIGLTAFVDYDAACEKWETYIEPVNKVIDAIRNKELGLADAVRGVTQCGVQIYAQAKLLNGLQHLYDGVKTQAVAYMHHDAGATPCMHRATPEGQLLRAVTEDMHACHFDRSFPSNYIMTNDGRLIQYTADALEAAADDMDAIVSGMTGGLALWNNLTHTKDRETVSEMLARLAREKAAAGGGTSPQGPKKDDDKNKDRPKARNWNEYFEKHEVGRKYKGYFEHTGIINPKDEAPIRRIKRDIPNAEMFKQGYHVSPDRAHQGDHFEVWDKKGNWIGVANLDGSKNMQKTCAEINPASRKIRV